MVDLGLSSGGFICCFSNGNLLHYLKKRYIFVFYFPNIKQIFYPQTHMICKQLTLLFSVRS